MIVERSIAMGNPMAEKGIFETVAASGGTNEPDIHIPQNHQDAVKWVVYKLSKLTSDRLMTAHAIRDIRKAAKNDGYEKETFAAITKLRKMSPERRDKYRDNLQKAFGRFGFAIEVAGEDAPPDRRLDSHLAKLAEYERSKQDINQEMRDISSAAKARGMDVPGLKQMVKLARMDSEDRDAYLASMDHLCAVMGFGMQEFAET